MIDEKSTNQVTPPTERNPTGKGGFGDHPEHRNPGSWRKEDTARYKLEQMLKMSEKELKKVYDNDKAPLFERKLSKCIRDGDWKTVKEMMHEVYGTPKQSVDMTTGGQPLQPLLVEIIDKKDDVEDTDTP